MVWHDAKRIKCAYIVPKSLECSELTYLFSVQEIACRSCRLSFSPPLVLTASPKRECHQSPPLPHPTSSQTVITSLHGPLGSHCQPRKGKPIRHVVEYLLMKQFSQPRQPLRPLWRGSKQKLLSKSTRLLCKTVWVSLRPFYMINPI
jgi:hypothetical protein